MVTDARVLSSIMTLTLWALSYTGGLYAETPFSRIWDQALGSLVPLRPAADLTVY